MASKKRQREIERAERTRELEKAASRRRRWIAFSIIAALAAMFAIFANRADSPATPTTAKATIPEKWTLDALLKLKLHQIEDLDIALLNLLCAEGLPGSESLDLDKSLTVLDEMARRVMLETDRHMYRFTGNPAEFNHSEADFRMMMMATVLQQDFGIRYNPERISPPEKPEPSAAFFANSKDFFIHGCTDAPHMGTCASLPVFYTAIARRLKYPLHIVTTKGHLFARWDNGKERLNLEATSIGFATHPDSKYRDWPYGITDAEITASKYLANMNATEELATFLSTRAFALLTAKRYREAVEAADASIRFAPHIEAWRIVKDLIIRQTARANIPKGHVPPDPLLQMTGYELDWALRRAKVMREANRNRNIPIDVPDPECDLQQQMVPMETPPFPIPLNSRNSPLPSD